MTSNQTNPYSPPRKLATLPRGCCPVCQNQVPHARFAFPFGHCSHCGNFLTIRNWDGPHWPFVAIVFGVVFFPDLVEMVWQYDLDLPVIPILFACLMFRSIYDMFTGNLVPAVCWGFFALPDNDRLEHSASVDDR